MPLNELAQQCEKLDKQLRLLRNYRNSQLPINKAILDILYRIFALAIFGSSFPATTALNISHVCRHWRESALEWPSLWGFIDFNHRRISGLFLKRSRNAPITLSWPHPTKLHWGSLFNQSLPRTSSHSNHSSRLYFESCAYLLPRLETLELYISFTELKKICTLFPSSEPLHLRSLSIGLSFSDRDTYLVTDWFELLSTDATYLRELTIRGFCLPWMIPPHQNLTRLFIIYPNICPTSTQLLMFLFFCPALEELEISLFPKGRSNTPSTSTDTVIERLVFPRLIRLELCAMDTRSYECVREVSSRIIVERLSSFWMEYRIARRVTPMPTPLSPASLTHIFELAPAGVLSCFKTEPFLSITIDRPTGLFSIHAGRNPDHPFGDCKSSDNSAKGGVALERCPLSLTGNPNGVYDHSPIIDLIREMPELRHLRLVFLAASELFTAWNVDLPSVLPHSLTTMEICSIIDLSRDFTDCLTALIGGFPNLNLQTLILRGVVFDSSVLPEVVLKTGIKTLELSECRIEPTVHTILREQGVDVISVDEDLFTVAGCINSDSH